MSKKKQPQPIEPAKPPAAGDMPTYEEMERQIAQQGKIIQEVTSLSIAYVPLDGPIGGMLLHASLQTEPTPRNLKAALAAMETVTADLRRQLVSVLEQAAARSQPAHSAATDVKIDST